MGCGLAIARVFLVVVNTFFTVLGIALLVIGCLVKFKEDLVTKYAKDLFKVIKLDSAVYNLDELLSSSAIVFIIVGVVILIVGVLGCFGTCCGWRVFLVIYAIIVILVIIVEITGVVLAALMKKDFDCCGVDNYMDFMNATHWSKTYNGQTLKTPLSCCKGIEGEFPDIKYPADTTCATNPIDANSNWENGCFYAIKDFINKYSNLFIGIGGGVVINQIYCIIFAIIIYRNVKEGEKIV